MDIANISKQRFAQTITLAVFGSVFIVVVAAGIGRATLNLNAALTDKPDIAIYMLLPDEEIHSIEVLRETEIQRDYLAHTKNGDKLVILKKGEKEWYVSLVENLKK